MVDVCVVGQHIHTEWALLPIYEELKRQKFDVECVQTYRGQQLVDAEAYLYSTADIPRELNDKSFFVPHSIADEFLYGGRASFVPGPYYASDEYKTKWNLGNGSVIETGWAKLDELFCCEKLQLNLPHERTVLYSPTQNLDAYAPLVHICSKLGVNLIVKVHHRLKDFAKCAMTPAVWIPWEKSVTPLYHIADVLVSDISSTLREFIATDKPTIQLLTDVSDKDYYGGMLHSSIADLESTLRKALENPDEIAKERREWRDKLFYKLDGHASKRVVKALKQIMGW